MYRKIPAFLRLSVGTALLVGVGFGTLIPRLSLEKLTDSSELVVSGQITRSWAAWDADHKYIWTHYELMTGSVLKGSPGATVEFAEPGGQVDGRLMVIGGAVSYAQGNQVVVFLSRMPNRYLRTTGWAQGKYSVDSAGRLHSAAAIDGDVVPAGAASGGASLRTLENMTVNELRQRVAARQHANGSGRVQ